VAPSASKHNPFLNVTGTRGAISNMVEASQLATDAATGTLPTFGLVVPDQCHDVHATGTGSGETQLIQAGDTYVKNTVAIVVTWDEDDCSDSGAPGTGC
jgi:phosphatidylinositol-3-phosphatase